VNRRNFMPLLLLPACLRAAEPSYRGKLTAGPGGQPALETASGLLLLAGDEPTVGVLKDKRLAGVDFEVLGKLEAGKVTVGPIHTRAMFVHKNGKRLMVTYWCEVCYIRTYTPGVCWCCQDDTALDLLDPDKVDKT
jgi:hypothetical protein